MTRELIYPSTSLSTKVKLLFYDRCTLYQHPRIRWSRRRRSIVEPEIRHRRSAYLRQYYDRLRRTEPTQQNLDQLYNKYNHGNQKPTLRHANFKIMKKSDADFGDPSIGAGIDEENFPTAVYTVYNVHGEPIGHRLYAYQPVYEPEDGDVLEHNDVVEYQDSDEDDELSHATIVRGGMFRARDSSENSIDRLKHDYFERYLDKRRKRFLNKHGEEKKEFDDDMEPAESTVETVTKIIEATRRKRNVNVEEHDTDYYPKSTVYSGVANDLQNDLLKVIPLSTYETRWSREMSVGPLQHNETNSTGYGNVLEKRDKRTSRKTDRLNQTTATVPKT